MRTGAAGSTYGCSLGHHIRLQPPLLSSERWPHEGKRGTEQSTPTREMKWSNWLAPGGGGREGGVRARARGRGRGWVRVRVKVRVRVGEVVARTVDGHGAADAYEAEPRYKPPPNRGPPHVAPVSK